MSKGGSSGPSEVTQITTNLPEYARPYFEDMLGRTVYETTRPYEAYPGQRIADFSPYEQMGMRGMYDMAAAGAPSQLGMASDIASQIGYQDSNMGMNIAGGFDPQQIRSDYQAGTFDPGYAAGRLGQGYEADQRQSGYDPAEFDSGYEAGRVGQSYRPGTLTSDLRPADFSMDYEAQQRDPTYRARNLFSRYRAGPIDSGYEAGEFSAGTIDTPGDSEYEAGTFNPGYVAKDLGQDYTAKELESKYAGDLGPVKDFEAGTVADAETLEKYMNPYQQLVTDIEKREARRQSDITGSQISQQAASAGGLGGYREAIMQSERERNLGQQLDDIQTRGGQAAYQQALQTFEADRAARLQESDFGLSKAQAQDQAKREAEGLRQSAFQTSEQARQEQQNMAIRSYEAGEGARQRAADLGLSAQEQADAAP